MGTGAKVAGVIGGIICAIAAGAVEAVLFDMVHYMVVILAGVFGGAIVAAMFAGATKGADQPPAA